MLSLPETKTVLKENSKVYQYSEDSAGLKKLLAGDDPLIVSYKIIGVDKYFPGDKEERPILRVWLKRGKTEINFRFGMSIKDREILERKYGDDRPGHINDFMKAKKEVIEGILYSILSCVSSDYFCPATLSEFCSEFGYDEDSRTAEKTFNVALKQSIELKRVLTEEEVGCLPR